LTRIISIEDFRICTNLWIIWICLLWMLGLHPLTGCVGTVPTSRPMKWNWEEEAMEYFVAHGLRIECSALWNDKLLVSCESRGPYQQIPR
jgi:hypothetical protein